MADEETLDTNGSTVGAGNEAQPEEMVPRERLLRTLADLDNVRKRHTARIRAAALNERKIVLAAFLEVVDSLEAALKAHEGEQNEWMDGVRGIFRQMHSVLTDFDVEVIESLAQPFDPKLHEAVSRVAMPEQPDGTIVEVLGTGYRFGDGSLLRPAKVVVSHVG
jgi:molecular chaperone GrpE